MSEGKKDTYYEYDYVRNLIFKCEFRKLKGEYKLRKQKHTNQGEIPGNYSIQVQRQADEIKDLQNQLDQRMAMLETADCTFRDLMEKLESRTEEINKLKSELKNTNEQFAASLEIDEKTQKKLQEDIKILTENDKRLKENNQQLREQNELLRDDRNIKCITESLEANKKQNERKQNKIYRLQDELKQITMSSDAVKVEYVKLSNDNTKHMELVEELKQTNEKLKKSIMQIMKISFNCI